MNKYLKLFLAIFGAIMLANIVSSGMYSYLYRSETEKAIEQSKKHVEQMQKNQQAYIQTKVDRQNTQLSNTAYKANSFNSFNIKNEQTAYQKQQDNNYKRSLYQKKNKEAARLKRLKREQKREDAKEKAKLQREKYRIKQANARADREHIKKENLKTCKFWTQQYKDTPTAKNKSLKQTSCERAYSY